MRLPNPRAVKPASTGPGRGDRFGRSIPGDPPGPASQRGPVPGGRPAGALHRSAAQHPGRHQELARDPASRSPARWHQASPGRRTVTSWPSETTPVRAGWSDLTGRVSSQETEPRTLALGPASAMAFLPDSDRLAVLAPSLPGPDDADGARAEPRGDLGRGPDQEQECPAPTRKGSTWRCRPAGTCSPAPRARQRSGCSIPPPASRYGDSTITRRPSRGLSWIDDERRRLGLHRRHAPGMAPGRRDARHRRGDHRGGRDGLRAASGDRADLVGAGRTARLVPGGDPGPALGPGAAVRAASPRTSPGWPSAPWTDCSR